MKKSIFLIAIITNAFICYAQQTPPVHIMSMGNLPRSALVRFLLEKNTELSSRRDFVNYLATLYVMEANREGVNYEIAFAQMCYHTNYLKYGNDFVNVDMNNFGGLSSLFFERRGVTFNTLQLGIRAHIQHLKAYASEDPPKEEVVDTRYYVIGDLFGFGSSPSVDDLTGKWSGSDDYGCKIKDILSELYYGS